MAPKEKPPVIEPFNPLDKRHLGESIAAALLETDIQPLPPPPFISTGVYALYYTGPFPVYSRLAAVNSDGQYRCPIYVGKAVPAGARKGGLGFKVNHGQAIYKRLAEHAESVASAENLSLTDFACRFLVVDDIWIPLAESILIEWFRPVWNRVIDGFGNHTPGEGRKGQQMSPWDCLHPGREWVRKLQLQTHALSQDELNNRIENYLCDFLGEDTDFLPRR